MQQYKKPHSDSSPIISQGPAQLPARPAANTKELEHQLAFQQRQIRRLEQRISQLEALISKLG
jgi:hypothetical protein